MKLDPVTITEILATSGAGAAFLKWARYAYKKRKIEKQRKKQRDERIDESAIKIQAIYDEMISAQSGSIKEQVGQVYDHVKDLDKKINEVIADQLAIRSMSSDAIFECDETGRCVDVNSALCKMFGAQREEMLGYGWGNFICDEDKSRALEEWADGLKTNYRIYSSYHIIHGQTGRKRLIKYHAVIARDSQGAPHKIVGKCTSHNPE